MSHLNFDVFQISEKWREKASQRCRSHVTRYALTT